MKKIIGILITVLLLLPAFTQQKNDTELKQYLIDNSFIRKNKLRGNGLYQISLEE
ncbi:hypothetical protein [Treponema maltophilum]|uniref:hypothetical protein n=1 Tax=Treponema maltophilum TaxID=51160 RepID=UPI003D929709